MFVPDPHEIGSGEGITFLVGGEKAIDNNQAPALSQRASGVRLHDATPGSQDAACHQCDHVTRTSGVRQRGVEHLQALAARQCPIDEHNAGANWNTEGRPGFGTVALPHGRTEVRTDFTLCHSGWRRLAA